jgi:hypothetical protein
MLDGAARGEVRSELENTGFLINLTTVVRFRLLCEEIRGLFEILNLL